MLLNVESDAWADGQIESKLWLCRHLEMLWPNEVANGMSPNPVIWLLAGWYAQTAFLLFSRERIFPASIVSFDYDPSCEPIARKVNNRWEVLGRFFAYTLDINSPNFSFEEGPWGPPPDIIINTACEHLGCAVGAWYDKVPAGTFVVVQATDMQHEQHTGPKFTLDVLEQHKMSRVVFKDQISFSYPDKSFNRFMIMGEK